MDRVLVKTVNGNSLYREPFAGSWDILRNTIKVNYKEYWEDCEGSIMEGTQGQKAYALPRNGALVTNWKNSLYTPAIAPSILNVLSNENIVAYLAEEELNAGE